MTYVYWMSGYLVVVGLVMYVNYWLFGLGEHEDPVSEEDPLP